ncbi:hypothetical protein TRVL_09160 [Trypanosoma vivax]|nr:hypothetical protein TRVL_09160 [Trypanosoma vivax]
MAPAIATQRAALCGSVLGAFGELLQSTTRALRSLGCLIKFPVSSSAITHQQRAVTHASRTATQALLDTIASQTRPVSHRIIGRARLVGFHAAALRRHNQNI